MTRDIIKTHSGMSALLTSIYQFPSTPLCTGLPDATLPRARLLIHTLSEQSDGLLKLRHHSIIGQ
jgi:hypothetical protein